MPIWLELLVLTLLAYVLGLALGWLAWGPVRGDSERGGNG